MANLNGTDVNLDDELMVSLRDHLIKKGHLVKRDGEYFYTIKHFQDLDKAFRRLQRSFNNPFW